MTFCPISASLHPLWVPSPRFTGIEGPQGDKSPVCYLDFFPSFLSALSSPSPCFSFVTSCSSSSRCFSCALSPSVALVLAPARSSVTLNEYRPWLFWLNLKQQQKTKENSKIHNLQPKQAKPGTGKKENKETKRHKQTQAHKNTYIHIHAHADTSKHTEKTPTKQTKP